MNILDYIPIGYTNAIKRTTLNKIMARMGYSERTVRDMISQVNHNQNKEELIINLQDGKGYFRPAEDEDHLVVIWRMQNTSRTGNCGKNIKAADKYLSRGAKKTKKQDDYLSANQYSLSDYGIG